MGISHSMGFSERRRGRAWLVFNFMIVRARFAGRRLDGCAVGKDGDCSARAGSGTRRACGAGILLMGMLGTF